MSLVAMPAGAQTHQTLSLRGDGDYLVIPNSPALQSPSAITIEAWIRPSIIRNGRIVSKGDGEADTDRAYDLTFLHNGGLRLEFFLGPRGSGAYAPLEIDTPLPAGEWTHVAGVFDGAEGVARLFVGGVEVLSRTTTTAGASLRNLQIRQSTKPVTVGHTPPWDTTFFHGEIDEVRIWSVARSSAEIASGRCREMEGESGLEGSWHFNGDTLDSTGPNHGSLRGNAAFAASHAPDVEAPVVSCPGDLFVEADTLGGAILLFVASASDNCATSPLVACQPPSGSLFPLGTTLVTCAASDDAGNASECTFSVTVSDTEAPVMSCPSDLTRECDGAAGSVVEFEVTASDGSGNSTSCTFGVLVEDTIAPALDCPERIVVQCSEEEGAVVAFDVTAADSCGGEAGLTVDCTPPPATRFALGSTIVVCTASDASGNSSTCAFEVVVQDTTAPVLSCPSSIAVPCVGPQGAVVDFDVAAADGCDRQPELVCSPPSGSLFPIGRTTVACTAADAHGNSSACTFEVAVGISVLAIEPPEGSEDGGDLVHLTGCGFTTAADTRVEFDGLPAMIVSASPGRITVRTPPGSRVATVRMSNSLGETIAELAYHYVDPVIAARFGNVNVGRGRRADVLLVNGTAGDAERVMRLIPRERAEVAMAAPPSRESAKFALYAWMGEADETTLTRQPFGLGMMVFPSLLPFGGGEPVPWRVWNNIGLSNLLGVADLPSAPAPSTVLSSSVPATRPVRVTLQAFIQDDGSQIPEGYSISNAVVLRIE